MINWFKNYLEKRKQKNSLDSLESQIYKRDLDQIDESTITDSKAEMVRLEKETNILREKFTKKRKSDMDKLNTLNSMCEINNII